MIKISHDYNTLIVLYNNKEYYLSDTCSFNELLLREDILELPLSDLKDLVMFKDGYCDTYNVYQLLLAKIKYYDKVTKSFIYKDKSYWLSKDTRMGIRNLLNNKLVTFELVLDDVIITLSYDKAKKFMEDLEVYAYKCFVNTQKHLNNIKQIRTVEDLLKYDYTLGYPNKLILNE